MNPTGFLRRLFALIRKETRQMLRDRSNLAVGLLLPVALILLFGYGLSFDVKNAPVAVVMEDHSPAARGLVAHLSGSPYLVPQWAASMAEAEERMNAGAADAIVRVPVDFARRLATGEARVQLIVNGVDSSTANVLDTYIRGAVGVWVQQQMDRDALARPPAGQIVVVQRMWFNEAGESTWFLVPGLLVLVLTLLGAFLTALLIAREWERGTLESLFVTPVRPLELVLAKLAPYLMVGAIDLALCLLAAHYLFAVPMRGSLTMIVTASLLYLLVSLAFGLWISGKMRNQFQASQIGLLTSFLPATMLSGFVFDLRNVPDAIHVISQLLPATHFMTLVKTLFLAGDDWALALEKCLILLAYALVLIFAVTRTLKKTLD